MHPAAGHVLYSGPCHLQSMHCGNSRKFPLEHAHEGPKLMRGQIKLKNISMGFLDYHVTRV
jgi:hypothetical protein